MILLLLACASPKAPVNGTDTGAHTVDSGEAVGAFDLPEIEETMVQPTLSASEVAERLTTALSQVPDPTEIVEIYQFLMAQGDATCPGPGMNIVDTWLYGCDATTGYSYSGVTDWMNELHTEEGMTGTLTGVAGDFWIDTPDGLQLEGGGHSVTFTSDWLWVGEIAGSWRWDGGSAWLAHGFSGNLFMEYIANIQFSMWGAANLNGTHIAAHDLTIGAVCGGPIGSLSLRDPGGGWHKMVFTSCEPCTSVVFEGVDLGEACVEFSALLAEMESRL
jgi:hypothetical protein